MQGYGRCCVSAFGGFLTKGAEADGGGTVRGLRVRRRGLRATILHYDPIITLCFTVRALPADGVTACANGGNQGD